MTNNRTKIKKNNKLSPYVSWLDKSQKACLWSYGRDDGLSDIDIGKKNNDCTDYPLSLFVSAQNAVNCISENT